MAGVGSFAFEAKLAWFSCPDHTLRNCPQRMLAYASVAYIAVICLDKVMSVVTSSEYDVKSIRRTQSWSSEPSSSAYERICLLNYQRSCVTFSMDANHGPEVRPWLIRC